MIVAAALLALAAAAPPPAAAPSTPAWEAKAVQPDATDVKAQTYVVKDGDTLGHVVKKTGAGRDAIVHTNGLAAPFALKPGQKLQIPAGRYHRVGKGESGIAIARAYGVPWSQIATLNHIEQGDLLREGDRLLLPSKREVSVMSIDERARAFTIDIPDLVTGTEPALAKHAKPVAPVKTAVAPPPDDEPVAQPKGKFAGQFAWPLHGRTIRPFGPLPTGARNNGINIAAKAGEPVDAAADGVVAFAGPLAAFGNLVLIRHAGGWNTVYGHLRKLAVTRGQAVKRGQPIGEAGATGAASEPQLHFEILNGRQAVNPIDRLPAN